METLEGRSLLAMITPAAALNGPVPNETVDQAFQLGDLSVSPAVAAPGSIGNGPYGGADVDWYGFTIDRSALVDATLAGASPGSPFPGILGLYNNDPLDFGDPYDPEGYRLIEQSDRSGSSGATIDRLLGPGTYYLAVSGAGNAYFNPLLAGSGYDGATGNFLLALSATNAGPGPNDGPAVLTSDPAPGAVISSSPFEIRLDLSGPIDPATILPGQNVQLNYSPNGDFSDGTAVPVPLNPYDPVNFSSAINELQIIPEAPLAPGYYQVTLSGNGDAHPGQTVLAAPSGLPLGSDAAFPDGQDYFAYFQVNGCDGNTGPDAASDDTPATAHNLGDVTSAGLVQVAGAIGVDPYYNPASTDPSNNNPGDQVDLYHFQVSGPGSYAFLAEVFAGRINSPLDPGVSLYELDPASGMLQFIAGNNNTYDTATTTDGQEIPLYSDSYLAVNITAGDYYVAVAGGSNTPSPLENLPPGTPGLFNPNVSHSGQLGWSTGPYVLNLLVTKPASAPQVVSTSPADGASLAEAPTTLTVQFSSPVNIAQLAFQTFQQTSQDTVSAVYIQGADGTRYFPRFESYDPTTNQATFLMLDRLPPGTYALDLSGAQGLTDLAGDPLAGNSPDGDYVTSFTVQPGAQVLPGDPSDGYTVASTAVSAGLQDLGVLFPHELQAGVTVTRDYSQDADLAPADTSESYEFQVLQNETYTFNLSGVGLPAGVTLSLTDQQGRDAGLVPLSNGQSLFGLLAPGTYIITVGNWSAGQSAEIAYQLAMTFVSANDNAPPLVSGPIPALQLMLNSLPGSAAADTQTVAAPIGPTPSSGVSGVTGASAGTVGTAPESSDATTSASSGASAGSAAFNDEGTTFTSASQPVSGDSPHEAPGTSATSATATNVNPVGLIALGVAPVGSAQASSEAFAPAAAQATLALPTPASTLPPMAAPILRLLTTLKAEVEGLPTDPAGPVASLPAGEAAGPGVVFAAAAPPRSELSVPASTPPGAVAAERTDGAGAAAADPVLARTSAALPALSGEAAEEPAEVEADEVHGPFRLTHLAWGAALVSLASLPLVLIHRGRFRPSAPGFTRGRQPAANGPHVPDQPLPRFAHAKHEGNRRARLKTSVGLSHLAATPGGPGS